MDGGMDVALKQALDDATERRLREHGQLQYFEAESFVQALEREIRSAEEHHLGHMRIDMNLTDAGRLAGFMRRAILLGA